MKYVLAAVLMVITTGFANAGGFEQHIRCNYHAVVDRLREHGWDGPFARELARYALIRQVVEDGCGRADSTSIVGMCIGGTHAKVMADLGLKFGTTSDKNLKLRRVSAPDGGDYYGIYGPKANVCSATAVALLWDRYITADQRSRFPEKERIAWTDSKNVSERIACDEADPNEVAQFESLKPLRIRAIERANGIYSSTASSTINSIVKRMDPVFTSVTD